MARDLPTFLVYARAWPVLGGLAYYTLKLIGVEIPRSVRIGRNFELAHGGFGVVVHSSTVIGERVKLYPGVGLGRADIHVPIAQSRFEGIVIEDDVWISFGVTILRGVTIGKRSVIAAGSMVIKDVPPDSVYRCEINPIITPIKQSVNTATE